MVRERARTFCSAFRAARLTFGKAMGPRNHPLGARYEEMDAVALFDDVFIPWERVFCYRDIDICNQFYDVTEDENRDAPSRPQNFKSAADQSPAATARP